MFTSHDEHILELARVLAFALAMLSSTDLSDSLSATNKFVDLRTSGHSSASSKNPFLVLGRCDDNPGLEFLRVL